METYRVTVWLNSPATSWRRQQLGYQNIEADNPAEAVRKSRERNRLSGLRDNDVELEVYRGLCEECLLRA